MLLETNENANYTSVLRIQSLCLYSYIILNLTSKPLNGMETSIGQTMIHELYIMYVAPRVSCTHCLMQYLRHMMFCGLINSCQSL